MRKRKKANYKTKSNMHVLKEQYLATHAEGTIDITEKGLSQKNVACTHEDLSSVFRAHGRKSQLCFSVLVINNTHTYIYKQACTHTYPYTPEHTLL